MNIQITIQIQNGELSLTPLDEMTAKEREEYEKLAYELIGQDRIVASVIYCGQTLKAVSPFYPRECVNQKAEQIFNTLNFIAQSIRRKIECEATESPESK